MTMSRTRERASGRGLLGAGQAITKPVVQGPGSFKCCAARNSARRTVKSRCASCMALLRSTMRQEHAMLMPSPAQRR